jgi:hypothetical protein
LNAGKIGLFTGMSCRNAGLRSSLGNKLDDLFMLAIICHDTPSLKIYRKTSNSNCGGCNKGYLPFKLKTDASNPENWNELTEQGRKVNKRTVYE